MKKLAVFIQLSNNKVLTHKFKHDYYSSKIGIIKRVIFVDQLGSMYINIKGKYYSVMWANIRSDNNDTLVLKNYRLIEG